MGGSSSRSPVANRRTRPPCGAGWRRRDRRAPATRPPTARSRASPGASSRFGGPAPPRSRSGRIRTYTVEFGADGRYSGRAHCNSFTGALRAPRAGALTIRAGAATLAACPQPSIADEYLRALASVTELRAQRRRAACSPTTRAASSSFVREPQQTARGARGRAHVRLRLRRRRELHDAHRPRRDGALGAGVARWRLSACCRLTRAASGARYEEGDTVFWNKGDLATIEIGGQRYVDCRSNPSKVPWADAARRGATFRALGNEPSWYVEIFPERLAIVTELGANRSRAAARRARRRGRPNDLPVDDRGPRRRRSSSSGERAPTRCPARRSKPRPPSSSTIAR